MKAKQSLIAFRGVLGVGAILAPRAMGKVFGVDPADNPVSPYLMRLFGIRELYMAYDLQTTPDVEGAFVRGIPVDSADAVASILGGLAGYLPPRTAVMSTVAAIAGAAHGIMARAQTQPSPASVM